MVFKVTPRPQQDFKSDLKFRCQEKTWAPANRDLTPSRWGVGNYWNPITKFGKGRGRDLLCAGTNQRADRPKKENMTISSPKNGRHRGKD
jgi:hypothetical protein